MGERVEPRVELRQPIPPFSRSVKRALDVLIALVALVLTAPLWAYIALRIRLGSRGPVLFRQERLGESQRTFTMLKFRTMVVGTSDEDHRRYIEDTMSGLAAAGDNGLYKLDRSDQVTAFGRWLRQTSLDELPQLVNVLRGEMAIVGPRPCLAYEVPHFEAHHLERFCVPAGITGLWQVCHRASADFREALELDVEYVRTFSIWRDLSLMVRTLPAIIRDQKTV